MNGSRSTASLPRSIGVALGVTSAAVTVVRVLLEQLTAQVRTAEEAVVGSCLLALVACAAWAWLAAMSVVLEASAAVAPGARRIPGVPPVVRRMILAACGVVVASALSQPASAAGDDARQDSLAGLPMPERALGAAHAPAAHSHAAPSRPLVVRPGDSLWSLAAEDLGPEASAAAVEARWRSIYRLNRALIGPDPDLIRPGQLLELPPSP